MKYLPAIFIFSGISVSCSDSRDINADQLIEHLSAGEATSLGSKASDFSASAYSEISANLTDIDRIRRFEIGDDFFESNWVEKQSSPGLRDGLGPNFNNNTCEKCHIRDGRGHAPDVSSTEDGTDYSSILIRSTKSLISALEKDQMNSGELANIGDSSVGGQLQHNSILNVPAETTLRVSYTFKTEIFSDGATIQLRVPEWHLTSNYVNTGQDFDTDTVFSARVAQPMIGLGMLSQIDVNDILVHADPDDTNGDGISGKPNWVWDIKSASVQLGRFGWKAGQPSLLQQTAAAFSGDMGLTSEFFPNENCISHQTDCIVSANGNGDQNSSYDFEVSSKILSDVVFYARNLAVPARRDAYSGEVQNGKRLFHQAGCGGCHVSSYTTQNSGTHVEQSEQVIFPYTDLLLHDMGEALADFTLDNDPVSENTMVEFQASAREWRTPPLWGLGLTHTVDPQATFLHDGRARTIMEAVLWHGGEAEYAKQNVLKFNAQKRKMLLAFLNDL